MTFLENLREIRGALVDEKHSIAAEAAKRMREEVTGQGKTAISAATEIRSINQLIDMVDGELKGEGMVPISDPCGR